MNEEEAIVYFKNYIKVKKEVIKERQKEGLNADSKYTQQLEEMVEAFEIVIKLLEKKDKQINSKNGTINALHAALKERTEERDKKDDIITKQSKIINLIYDFLYKFGSKFSGSFMKALSENGFDIKKCENCEYETCDCKDCIKQYFENKSKENPH